MSGVYGYARVSTAEQVNGSSLGEQRRQIEGIAMVRGAEVERMFLDEGVSGSIPFAQRSAGAELLAAVRPGDLVVAAKLDRIFRSARDALTQVEWFQEHRVDLILLDIGMDPVTGTGVSKLFFTIMAAVAEFERERIGQRRREGMAAKKARGGYTGGKPQFGWKAVGKKRDAIVVEVPEEQAVRVEVLRLKGQGLGLRTIAKAMLATHGCALSHETIRQMRP
jgi:putative DNA-invertase from lambdoid prophage Rac